MSQVETSNAGADSTNPANESKPADATVESTTATAPNAQDVEKKDESPADKLYAETTAKEKTDATTEEKKDEVKYDLKIPEGSLLSAKVVEEIKEIAIKSGLNPEQAQVLLNRESAALTSYQESLSNQHKQITEQWVQKAKSDPEIGGEKFAANVEQAHRALKKFGSPAFTKELEVTGYGNHPELIRVFSRIGALMKDDTFVAAGEPAAPKKSITEVWYDNTPKKG